MKLLTGPSLLLAALLLSACEKDDARLPGSDAQTTTTTAAAPTPSSSAAADEIADYPDEVPINDTTVEVLRDFAVHQAADPTSKTLSTIGPGTIIDLVASRSGWMKIAYVVAPGELGPGWIELSSTSDPGVKVRRDNPLGRHRRRSPRRR